MKNKRPRSKQKSKIKLFKNLNEMEIRNLSDKEFKLTVIKMFTKLRRRKDKTENINKKTENIRR